MKKSEMKVYKERLLSLRARLRGDVWAMADTALHKSAVEDGQEALSAVGHSPDTLSDSFDEEFTLSRLAADGMALEAIESALERIEDGGYGICAECEGRIPKTRLNAIPFTPYCVKCASKFEGR